jgi:predicted molibdopterin-dependent oxidoreductase YjgC
VFGAGGGTSGYADAEQTDVVLLWGSNARDAHPIFFHHVIKGVRNGAKLYVIDPRRTASAQWGDAWLPVRVGADIALANAIGHVLVAEGLVDRGFVANATADYAAWERVVLRYAPEAVEPVTGVPAALVRRVALDYGRAKKAMICWTLGITEHHNAVENVWALINLALATGHVGRCGSGLNPLRGQNNVQGGGDMGALPNKLPGFQDVEDDAVRARFDAKYGAKIPPKHGRHLTEMFHAMEHGELRALYVLGENPARSEADGAQTLRDLEGLDHLVVQDTFLTRTAELAHVVLPATAAWCEAEGTVTNSERRVQRYRPAVPPPPGARDDIAILHAIAARLGVDLGVPTPALAWDECRELSPMHRGMSWDRLDALGGIQWPCPDEGHDGTPFLHARLHATPRTGMAAAFHAVEWVPVAEPTDDAYPLLLTTGRRLDAFNTGVQSGALGAPLSKGEALELSTADAAHYGVVTGDRVRVKSRRGEVVTPIRVDPTLRTGLAFMTFHFPDEVDTNQLTINATDPRSGTAEFKAAAIAIERIEAAK